MEPLLDFTIYFHLQFKKEFFDYLLLIVQKFQPTKNGATFSLELKLILDYIFNA